MKAFEGKSKIFQELYESEKAFREVLSLPIEPLLREDEVNYVVEKVRKFSRT